MAFLAKTAPPLKAVLLLNVQLSSKQGLVDAEETVKIAPPPSVELEAELLSNKQFEALNWDVLSCIIEPPFLVATFDLKAQ
jgi:hypothetical protein